MKMELMGIMSCPHCQDDNDLKLMDAQWVNSEVFSGNLQCQTCSRVFPIVGGVPDFLSGRHSVVTQKAFTRQWELRQAGFFEDAKALYFRSVKEVAETLIDRLRNITRNDDGQRWLLDGGCGSGEKAVAVAEAMPDVFVVALDFSDTINDIAQRDNRNNLYFVKADIGFPPFKSSVFGAIYSSGVLHHTPDTERAFYRLANLVRARGKLLIWLYPHPTEISSDSFFNAFYRVRDRLFGGFGHRMPVFLRLWLLRFFCIPLLVRKQFGGLNLASLSSWQRFHGAVFMFYDDIAPKYQHRHRQSEVLSWYQKMGFINTTRIPPTADSAFYEGIKS